MEINKIFFPDVSLMIERFNFIKKPTILKNIEIYISYIFFLYELSNKFSKENLSYSINKNIIIYSSQIVEACCLYTVQTLIENNKFTSKELLGEEWVNIGDGNTKIININKLTEDKSLIRVKTEVEEFKSKNFSSGILFGQIKDACKKAGFKTNIVKFIDEMKKRRNKIHIGGLEYVDDTYTISNVNESLLWLGQIIDECIFVLQKFSLK